MHRDLKIGLALGVLLVGVVGAFFFRRDPLQIPGGPVLADIQALDDRIAEKPRTPYLVKASPVAERKTAPTVPAQSSLADELPDFLSEADAAIHRQQLSRPATSPQAIPLTQHSPAKNAGWQTVSTSRPGTPVQSVSQQKPMTHVIRAGDTLTDLSKRYLGSHARFRELYEANQDVIPDPNRLPVGTMIRIPEPGEFSAAVPRQPPVQSEIADDPFGSEELIPAQTERPSQSISPAPTDNSEWKLPREPVAPSEARITPIIERQPIATRNPVVPVRPVERVVEHVSVPPENPAIPPAEITEFQPQPSTTAPRIPQATQQQEIEGVARSYRVRRGDSLERIATRMYGDPLRAREIYSVNQHKLRSPHEIREGLILVLP